MSRFESRFFVVGGTVPSIASSYVVRQADTDLYTGLRRGDFCYVLNTRQMGKSSLMVRTVARLRADGLSVAVLDLTAVGQNLSVEQWYFGLAVRIANQLQLDRELIAFWRAHQEFGPMQRFIETLRQVVLPILPNSLVLFIDEVDAVQSLPFASDEFFAGIRECYNRRTQDSDFYRLTFCLLGVATPADLIRDTRISPFNIGRRIEIRDFTPEEAAPLAEGLIHHPPAARDTEAQREEGEGRENEESRNAGMDSSFTPSLHHSITPSLHPLGAQRLLDRILYWTGGHPYLTQRLCQAVAEALLVLPDPCPSASSLVDAQCRSLFFTRTALETEDNLAFVRNRLLRSDADLAALLDLYKQIRSGRRIKDDETNALCATLRLSGVVRVEGGFLRVRNRLYDHVFDQEWVQAHTPGAEIRRQRAAYRRGVIRTAAAAAAVVLVTTSLAILAITRAADARRASERAKQAGRKAIQQEQLANARLSRLYVAEGNRLVEDGEYAEALAPLVEAMNLDAADPGRMEIHRLRVNSVLERIPALKHLWFSAAPIRHAEASPDGRLILAAGEDGSAQVWESDTGVPLPIPMRHVGAVTYAAFSPDGRRVVTCGEDGLAQVWDLITRRALCTLPHQTTAGSPEPVVSAAWSRDGGRIVTCGGESAVVWDIGGTAPRRIARLWEQYRHTKQAALSADGSRCTVIADNYIALIYDLKTAKFVARLGSNASNACFVGSHVEYSPDGRHILVSGAFGGAGQKKGACIFDAETGKPALLLQHKDNGMDARYSADGRRIVTASDDQTARVWNASKGRPLTPPLRHGARVLSAVFSADGRWLLTSAADGKAHLWDASAGVERSAPLQHAGAVVSASFAGAGCLALTAGKDGTLRLWDVTARKENSVSLTAGEVTKYALILEERCVALQRRFLQTGGHFHYEAQVRDVRTGRLLLPPAPEIANWNHYALSDDDGRIALIGADGDHRVQVWDVRTARPLSPVLPADEARFSHDGRTLLLIDAKGIARLRDVDAGRERGAPFPFHFQPDPKASLFSPDDSRIVTVGEGNSVLVVSNADGRLLTPPMRHADPVFQVYFSPDGNSIVTCTDRGESRIWDARSGAARSDPQPGRDERAGVRTFALFSPDRRYMVTTEQFPDQPTLLWDLSGPGRVKPPVWLPNTKEAVFSSDSSLLAINGAAPRIWNTQAGAPGTPPLEIDAEIHGIRFSPDNRSVVTGSANAAARLWDAHNGRPVTAPMAHHKVVTAAAFSPNGRLLVTGCADGTLRCWDAATGEAVTPPLTQAGPIIDLEFLRSGMEFVAFSRKETRLWPLQQQGRSLQEFDALALFYSGQRIDANIGTITVERSKMREAWRTLSGKEEK